MAAPSPEGYVPVDAGGEYRLRLERGLERKGYHAVWGRCDFDCDLGLSRLELRVLDGRYCEVRSRAVTFRRDHRCEGLVAECICEDLVLGGAKYGEPIRYG